MTIEGEVDLATKVFQAIGAASVCWENIQAGRNGGLGVFDTTRAKAIADDLLLYINSNYVRVDKGDPWT